MDPIICTSRSILLLLMLSCWLGAVDTFSPPIGRGYFMKRQQEFRSRPQPLLDAGFMRNMRKPPALRVMAGPPGGYSDILQQEETMDRWYVAPPGGYSRADDSQQAADKAQVERLPVGPPGSDAAAMGSKLHYGPPAAITYDRRRGPPSWQQNRY